MGFSYLHDWFWLIVHYGSIGYTVSGILCGLIVTYYIVAGKCANSNREFFTSPSRRNETSSKYRHKTAPEQRKALAELAQKIAKDSKSNGQQQSALEQTYGLYPSTQFPEQLFLPEEYTVPRPLPRKVRKFLGLNMESKKQSGFLSPRTPISPHINTHYPLGVVEALKLIVMATFVAPARLWLATFGCLFAWICLRVSTLGTDRKMTRDFADFDKVKPSDLNKPRPRLPVSGWRRKVAESMRPWARLWAANAYSMAFVREYGTQCTHREAGTIVANHISLFEAPVLVTQNILSPVAKEDATKVPLVGGIMQQLDTVTVARNNPDSRRLTRKEIQFRACDVPQRGYVWPQILIFPEGTTSSQDTLLKFKTGCFSAGAPVQPAHITLENSSLDLSLCNSGPQTLELLFRALLQFYNTMNVYWLPPYHPNENEKKDAELFAENVRRELARFGKVLLTGSSFVDTQLGLYAQKKKLSSQFAYVEADDFRDAQIDLPLDKMKKYFDEFVQAMSNRSGYLTRDEFANSFSVELDANALEAEILDDCDLKHARAVVLGRLFEFFSVELAVMPPAQQFPPLPSSDAANLFKDRALLTKQVVSWRRNTNGHARRTGGCFPSLSSPVMSLREYFLCRAIVDGLRDMKTGLGILLLSLSRDSLADTENEYVDDLLELLEAQSVRSEILTESTRLDHLPWRSTGTGDAGRGDVAVYISSPVLKRIIEHGLTRRNGKDVDEFKRDAFQLIEDVASAENASEVVSAGGILDRVAESGTTRQWLNLLGFGLSDEQ